MMNEESGQAVEREYARKKLQKWSTIDAILYPRHISLEQCSSEHTAKYKATLIGNNRGTFVDLTGGFGVDCYYIGQNFEKPTYIEQNLDLCKIVESNYHTLGFNKCKVVCGEAESYLYKMDKVHLIYIDPARRDNNGRRTYAIEDCTPNVKELNNLLLEKADKVIIKLSPMFDWHKAVRDMNGVTEVHIVSVGNECKELLLVLENTDKPLRLICVDDDVSYERKVIKKTIKEKISADSKNIEDYHYLYEPNASIMKAGCFQWIAEDFNVIEISPNSHLFLSEEVIENFPGRKFEIKVISTLNKKEIKQKLQNINKANITTRNFPMKSDELRKKLHFCDGGDNFIFATTTKGNKHLIFVCNKIFL